LVRFDIVFKLSDWDDVDVVDALLKCISTNCKWFQGRFDNELDVGIGYSFEFI